MIFFKSVWFKLIFYILTLNRLSNGFFCIVLLDFLSFLIKWFPTPYRPTFKLFHFFPCLFYHIWHPAPRATLPQIRHQRIVKPNSGYKLSSFMNLKKNEKILSTFTYTLENTLLGLEYPKIWIFVYRNPHRVRF